MRTILKGATIIDCINPKPLENYNLTINGDSITAIDKEVQIFKEDHVIDLSGKTILPGLINMHVHLTADDQKNLMPDMLSKSDEQLLLQAVKASQLTLKSGVTTVRDCGSRNNLVHWLRDAINEKKLTGPRIISSGMPITITGGHCYYIGLEADGEDEVRKAVRSLVKSGADFIKIMVTGGGCTPNTDKKAASYTDQELYAAVDEAHRHGRKVAAHAHGTSGIKQAVKIGVDTIEHCSFLTEKGMKAENDILELIREKEIAVVPTISGNIRLVYNGYFTKNEFNKSVNGFYLDHFRGRFELFKDFLKSGVIIIAGSDSGTDGTPHNDFVSELEIMGELGMEAKEVIQSATSKAAKILGLEDEIGTIEAGKKADLLVVEGNPLQNIQLLRNPSMVMIAGKEIIT
jgi:imidazolonepropionase-like amidohydrolase